MTADDKKRVSEVTLSDRKGNVRKKRACGERKMFVYDWRGGRSVPRYGNEGLDGYLASPAEENQEEKRRLDQTCLVSFCRSHSDMIEYSGEEEGKKRRGLMGMAEREMSWLDLSVTFGRTQRCLHRQYLIRINTIS